MSMNVNSLVLGLFLFLVSFLITYLVRIWALNKKVIDQPNERSSHTIPTPRGGGIAVIVSWFIGIYILWLYNFIDQKLFLAFFAAWPIIIISFLDDVYKIKPITRFVVQAFSATLALIILGGKVSLDLGFYQIHSVWIVSPFALVFIVWFINLFNFLDGIDGYIAMEIIFLGVASSILFNNSVGYILAVATLGFLFWNWPKAKIFMGDVGSTFLGFNIAILAIYQQNEQSATTIQWIILTSVFWFDATVTLFRRWRNSEKLSQPHRKHAYQRIVQSGFSHFKTTLWALGLNIIAFVLAYFSEFFPLYKLFFLLVNVMVLYIVLKLVDKRKAFS